MSTAPTIPMFAPDGSLKMVPNHLADAAAKAGGQAAVAIIAPDGSRKYAPQGKVKQLLSMGAKLAPVDQGSSGPRGSPWSRFLSSAWQPIEGAATGMYQAATAPAETPLEKGLAYVGVLPIKRALVDPPVAQLEESYRDAKEGKYSEAIGHSVAAGTPVFGPLAAQFAEKFGQQLGRGDYAGAAGTGAGNAALLLAPKVIGKVVPPVFRAGVEATREGLRRAAGVSPADLKTEAEEGVRTSQQHAKDTHEAVNEQQRREDIEKNELRNKTSDIEKERAAEAEKQQREHSASEEDKRKAYEKQRAEAEAHNERVQAKHATVTKRIQEENAAQEHVGQMRQQKEAELQKATDAYRAREEATDTRAKAAENQAWSAWRGKIKGATIDGGEIAGPLKKLRLDSPEVDRTLRQLEPSGDEVPQESPYVRLRDETARANFGGDYSALSPTKQEAVDTMMVRAGESPEPIDLNPEDGQPISVERVQRAYSILQRYIRSGRFEGPLLGEMKQVAKVLRHAVTNASEEHGALGDLDQARAETVRYQEAFGRERPEPRTVRGEREKTANPEEVKRLQEEERLEAARKYDPSLADAQQRVKSAREELKKLPSEDQLRKGNKQVPPTPTVNDLREGYRLKEVPKSPVPTRMVPRLTEGSAEEVARQSVPQPDRPEYPNRPEDVNPLARRAQNIMDRGHKITHSSQASVVGHTLTGIGGTWALVEALRGEFSYAGAVVASRVLVAGIQRGLGNLLENPSVAEWLAKPSKADIVALGKLTPEQRGVFGQHLQPLLDAAIQKGIKVDPFLKSLKTSAVVAAAVAPRHSLSRTPATHQFSVSQWRKNNPGGDVEAAKRKAIAQGYEVAQ